MQGRIIKGIGGFYYVYTAEAGILECRARGLFRNQGRKPLVGDDVEVSLIDAQEQTGNVEELLPRRSELIRPAVANVDQALVIFAMHRPEPSLNLLDRFLCMMEYQQVPAAICINKCDLAQEDDCERFRKIYRAAGYPLFFTSTKMQEGLPQLAEYLHGHTTTVAGPSGAGKSSLINALFGEQLMETGALSEKLGRGKNTTRHSQIFPLDERTFIVDTPGFTSLDLPEIETEDLWRYYREFVPYEPQCRFAGCSHISEPECGIRQAVEEGKISPVRYENYKILYTQLKERPVVYKKHI